MALDGALVFCAMSWVDVPAKGVAFRSQLTRADARSVHVAQCLFMLSLYVPCALYYAGSSEKPTKFPASISYTVSKGVPKYCLLTLWLGGWLHLLPLIWSKSDSTMAFFATQMVATGFFSFGFNRPKQGQFENQLHMVASALYIVDHVVFFSFLGTTWAYRAVFYASFALTAAALQGTRLIKGAAGLPMTYASTPAEWKSMLEVAGPSWRNWLWWSEMTFMIFENLVFIAFIAGMASGLPVLEE